MRLINIEIIIKLEVNGHSRIIFFNETCDNNLNLKCKEIVIEF